MSFDEWKRRRNPTPAEEEMYHLLVREYGKQRYSQSYLEAEDVTFGLPPLTMNVFPLSNELRAKVVTKQAQVVSRSMREIRKKCGFSYSRRATGQKLRIGYLSPDFRQHAVGTLIRNMFQYHDRRHFEIYAYSLVDAQDALNQQIRRTTDVYTDLSDKGPEKSARIRHLAALKHAILSQAHPLALPGAVAVHGKEALAAPIGDAQAQAARPGVKVIQLLRLVRDRQALEGLVRE